MTDTQEPTPLELVIFGGAGGTGAAAVQTALARGHTVLSVDLALPDDPQDHPRLSHRAANVLSDDLAEAVRGADAVLVTVGAAQVYDQAPRYLGWGGKVVMVGMPHGDKTSSFSPLIMASLGQAIVGSKMGDMVIKRDIPWIVDLYQQGRLKLDELISGRWSLDQINEAIEDTRSGAARRNVIMMK